jgi:molecular chaperone DnaJ
MLDTDYYSLLQVERTADEKAIKSAYRRLAMQCHPDKNPGCKDSEAKFKAISEAYDCLKDPQKRAAYDRFGHAAFKNGGFGGNGGAQDFGSFSDIFENIFGEFMNGAQGGQRSNMLRGSDLRYDLEISLEDAYLGKEVELRLDTTAQCEPCNGSGAKPGTAARTCTMCNGRGQVRASQAEVAPGPHSRRRRRGHPHPPVGRRRGGRARRPGRRSLHLHPPRPASGVRARRHYPVRALPGQLHHRRARRDDRGAGPRPQGP